MATVLTEPAVDQGTVHVSFPILKWERDDDGDLIIRGVATDGTVDHDSQIVDPAWSAKALDDWITSGGNVRQSHNPMRPIGKGLKAEVNKDGSGKHWVTSVIVDRDAQRLIEKGVLTAYSVGISHPVIKHDPSGQARGGIIVGGELSELSVVDRPANKSSYLQLAKAAGDGSCEFTGKMVGDVAVLEKDAGADLAKDADPASASDVAGWQPPADLSLNITPDDVMRLMQNKFVERHFDELAVKDIIEAEAAVYKRDINTAARRRLASEGNALADGSYPIENAGDLGNAAILARSHHGNYQAASRLIARRARELGVANPMDGDTGKEAAPDLVKDPATEAPSSVGEQGDGASAKPGKELDSQSLDADGDSDGDGDATAGIPKAAKPAKGKKPKGGKGKKLPPWLNKPNAGPADGDASKAQKCDTDPKTAAGAEEAADMDPAPLPALLESPAMASTKAEQVALRYKTLGVDYGMGAIHDFTCPAYGPDDVASYHPFADMRTLVDEELWQRKALAAATGRDIGAAMDAQQAWQAAAILKAADPGEVAFWRDEAHKAFRDANPGPASFPSPGAISPQRFRRPVLTDGQANRLNYDGPNTSTPVATSAPNARNFSRPPLGGTQQSPSPSFMKNGTTYPGEQGVPTRINYAEIEKEKVRRALSMMHEHLQHMFPSMCPMLDQDAYRIEENRQPPPTAGIGKSGAPEVEAEFLPDVSKYIRKLEKQVRAGLITEEEARQKLSRKTAERYARTLARDVQKGLTSIGAVKKALGLPDETPEPAVVQKAAVPEPAPELAVAEKALTPDVLKTMMAEILQPLQDRIEAQDSQIGEYQAKAEAQQAELDEYRKRWDALADQPDPSTTAFTGLALRKAATPAGIVKTADVSDRVQGMMARQLERTWRTSENPAEREAAYKALISIKGGLDQT